MTRNKIPFGNKFKNTNKLYLMQEIEGRGYKINAFKIAEKITEEEAFALEEFLVEKFGRQITKDGNLLNLEPGGKWAYPKIWVEDNEKIITEKIENEFPILIDIIDHIELLYPIIK